MSRTQMRIGLGLALAVTLVASGVAWMREPMGEVDVTVALPSRLLRPPAGPASGAVATPPQARGSGGMDDDLTLFEPAAWSAPVPVRLEAVPAPEVATVEVAAGPPPLPFRPLGRFDDDSGPVIFLMYGDQNLVVRPGERVVEGYRLEEVKGTVVGIRHLATGQLQTLELGSTP